MGLSTQSITVLPSYKPLSIASPNDTVKHEEPNLITMHTVNAPPAINRGGPAATAGVASNIAPRIRHVAPPNPATKVDAMQCCS